MKANVLFFDKRPAGEKPWTSNLWVYDKAKTRGEGPSPALMLDRRQQAGRAALATLLADPKPDPALAMALCAPLVHSRRRHLLPNLLDLLRGGAGGEGAIHIAYDLTLDQLASDR